MNWQSSRPWLKGLALVGKACLIAMVGAGVGLAYNARSENGIPLKTPKNLTRPQEMDWQLHLKGMRANLAEMRDAVATKAAVIVDARSKGAYRAGHIPGARHLSIQVYAKRHAEVLENVSKDGAIITYCAGGACRTSIELAQKLKDEGGYTNVKAFYGGWQEWRRANLDIVSGDEP